MFSNDIANIIVVFSIIGMTATVVLFYYFLKEPLKKVLIFILDVLIAICSVIENYKKK